MNINSELRAFTIFETIITLLISAILIGFIYQLYLVVSFQFQNYNTTQTEMGEYNGFITLLTRDFKKASRVIAANDEKLELEFPDRIITYDFDDNKIIRRTGINDTFNFPVSEVLWNRWSPENLVKEETVEFNTELLGRKLKFFETKKVGMSQIIENMFPNEY